MMRARSACAIPTSRATSKLESDRGAPGVHDAFRAEAAFGHGNAVEADVAQRLRQAGGTRRLGNNAITLDDELADAVERTGGDAFAQHTVLGALDVELQEIHGAILARQKVREADPRD